MPSGITFFSPGDPFALNTLLSLVDSDAGYWDVQSSNPVASKTEFVGYNSKGDAKGRGQTDKRTAVQAVYKCFAASGFLTVPKAGAISGGYHIDGWTLNYSAGDWPTLTITGHKHDGTTGSHTLGSCATYTIPLKLPAGVCPPSEIKDLDDASSFKVSALAVGMRSVSVGLACTHVDEVVCDWIGGDNHDGVVTLEAELAGVADSGDVTIASAWTKTSDGTNASNTAGNSQSISLVQHIAQDVPAGP